MGSPYNNLPTSGQSMYPGNISFERPTCMPALLSLWIGIFSWVMLPVIGALVAIILGHLARHQIKHNPALKGFSQARWGLILGYAHLFLYASVVVFVVVGILGGLAMTHAAGRP